MKTRLIAAALGLATLATASSAQVPANIAEKVRALGPVMDDSARSFYAAMFPKEAWAGVTIQRDIAYGADPLQKLDVFMPEGAQGKKLPVLLFVHGGGFTRGDKHGGGPDGFYPDNITLWAAKNGMVGVNIDYRLFKAPANGWPTGVKDLASAIGWTRANAAKYGGDPDRIVLFGHSAGANHVADYVAHPEQRGPEAAGVRGAVVLSPAYSTTPGAAANTYYSAPDLGAVSTQIDRLRAVPIPVFLGYAEFDPPPMKATAAALLDGLCKTPARCPKSVMLKDSNHFTEGEALGTSDQQLAAPVLQWIKALPAKG